MQAVEVEDQVGTDLTADVMFDLVIGDLEKTIPPLSSPMNSGSGTACSSTCIGFYCC